MKPHHAPAAARTLANHCPELFQAKEEVRDFGPGLMDLAERLSRTLAQGLSRLSGTDAPHIAFAEPRELSDTELLRAVAPLAANTLFAAGVRKLPFIASLEAASLFRLVDRAFGGRGEVPHPLPSAFPLSAELFANRLETVMGTAISQALGAETAGAIAPIDRNGRLARLMPQAACARLWVIEMEVTEDFCDPWKVMLAFPAPTLDALIAQDLTAAPARARTFASGNLAEGPCGDVPLTVSAMLVEMRIGFSRLAALKPGDVLPVSVARQVPLRVGDRTIGYGTIGEMDDRVAVQIAKAF